MYVQDTNWSYLLNGWQPLGFSVHCFQCLNVHVNNSWYHLMQTTDVFRADSTFSAHLVHKAGHHFDNSCPHFSWILFFKPGLCISTITLCHTASYSTTYDTLTF